MLDVSRTVRILLSFPRFQPSTQGAYLVESHQLFSIIALSLAQRCKLDVLRGSCLIAERREKGVQVMSSDSNQLPPSANVLVQLVLQVNERRVGTGSELDIAKHCASKEWSDFCCLRGCTT